MKSDMQLHQEVLAELAWEPSIREQEIGVAVKDGVVTLSGSVDSYPEKWKAERVVQRLAGVKAVANAIEVRLAAPAVRSDSELAHRVVDALAWDIQVPDEKITAKVANGWVTLDGEVEWKFQKDAAARALANLTGVRGVKNNITIKPTPVSVFDVSQQIKAALRRHAEREADKIGVVTKDGTVTLTGSVDSFADRQVAEGAAWSAPGVQEVRDEIIVNV